MRSHLKHAAVVTTGAMMLLLPVVLANAVAMDDFDHIRTGFPLTGAHERVPCESCHARGIFEGTPTRCASCHGGVVSLEASGKPANHVPSSDECGDCHITATWSVARFEHSGIATNCASCHNGSIASGRTANHVPSSNRCETCHRSLAWSPATFDHTTATGICASCHNGIFATGKSQNHIASSSRCEDCHGTVSWAITGAFDHALVTGDCVSCHDGFTASGKSPNHIPSSNRCEDCHDTISWAIAGGFDHSAVVGNCAGCHNGSFATGKTSNHFVTTIDCDGCHNTSNWLSIGFSHTSPTYPGDHSGSPGCTACHQSNSQAATWTFGAYRPDCAGCHADDFRPGPHEKIRQPSTRYSVGELRDCSGACHVYTDSSLTTIERSRSGEHRARDGEW
jgi:hypothetical protein